MNSNTAAHIHTPKDARPSDVQENAPTMLIDADDSFLHMDPLQVVGIPVSTSTDNMIRSGSPHSGRTEHPVDISVSNYSVITPSAHSTPVVPTAPTPSHVITSAKRKALSPLSAAANAASENLLHRFHRYNSHSSQASDLDKDAADNGDNNEPKQRKVNRGTIDYEADDDNYDVNGGNVTNNKIQKKPNKPVKPIHPNRSALRTEKKLGRSR